ncbi:MAG TPA: hypothetical protein VFX85_14455 [Solirubrobacterales bacterium]|nr:hypothetical protein [Solirubrobacterales bacterium]
MLPIVGLIFLAEALSVIQVGRVLEFLLTGGALGIVVGKAIVIWRELYGPELLSQRVRRTEGVWFLLGIAASLSLLLLF